MLRHLSRRNRVTLLAALRHPDEAEHVATLNELCESVVTTLLPDDIQAVMRRLTTGWLRGMPFIQGMHFQRTLAQHLHTLTAQNAYDVIQLEFSFMTPYLPFVSPRSLAKKVLSMHNVESLRFQRELQFASGLRRLALLNDRLLFRNWEGRCLSAFDGIVAVSASERAWIQQRAPAAVVELVPNGVDVEHFLPAGLSGASRSIVFTGLMNYPPNIDAVVWFCDEVLPLVHRQHPEVCFKIVGNKPDRTVLALARRKGVEVTGQVPDVRPYLSNCQALVVPLRSGAGTRLKILEAMAMRRPVVSTDVGAEGLEVTPGVNILTGNTAEELAGHIGALLADPQRAARLGDAGRRLAETKYDWKISLSKLDELYQVLLSRSPMAARLG